MFISRVKVLNFRSLTDVEIWFDRYTALVGLNDSGKSNLLRALNLFFNGQTDPGHRLVFANDFSQHAKIIGKKARQIEIEVEFSPPANYADKGPVIWRKVYRADSDLPYADLLHRKDGSSFSKGSKVDYWVRHVAFEYVPAIRGRHFFAILKRRLYTTLAATVAPKLKKASSTFLSNLRQEVKKIESESQRLLKLKTEFSLPGDLGELFEVLDFDSADSHSRTALQYRGDGIQGRHVPLILKFLADQRKKTSAMGKPPSETIWGFEEPENNLELAKQIEEATEFRDYSSSLQIIVSTHSPAFYGMAKDVGRISIAIRESGRTSFVESVPAESIDEQLGLMPFVQPYLEQAQAERASLIHSLTQLKAESLVSNKAALYVEGSSDKTILDAVFAALLLPINFEVVAKDGLGGGVNWVVDCCVARAAMPGVSTKTIALFDEDEAGKQGVKKLQGHCKSLGREGKVKSVIVGRKNANDLVRKAKISGINIPYSIEELCGASAWVYAENKGWLVERENMIRENSSLLSKNMSFTGVLDARVTDPNLRRLLEFKVADEKKGSFARRLAKDLKEGGDVPPSLEVLARELVSHFEEAAA